MYYGSALLLFIRKLHCLQIFEHMNQSLGVCEVSYLLGCLRYREKHVKDILISCGCMLLFTNM